MLSFFVCVLLGVAAVQAFPALVSREDITTVPTTQIKSYDIYTNLASAVFCGVQAIEAWNCPHCSAVPDFKPVAAGGDGDGVQFWYVGYEPSHQTVVVAHQGTNFSKLKPVLTDGNLSRRKPDSSLFPGISDDIEMHRGFLDEHAKTASDVLSNVQMTMSKYQTTSVTLVGHSLGAALSLLDSVYLPLHLPKATTFRSILYGLPRVGNQAFADYVDANAHITRITNLHDLIPILPGKFLGYVHPAGEVHISDSGVWNNCPGQDNPSKDCIVGTVSTILSGKKKDHDGPYDGILLKCATQ